VKAALAAGGAAAVPSAFASVFDPARASSLNPGRAYFLTPARWDTCRSVCGRIVPTGTDAATDPGAEEAWATVFIDRFLSAFELPTSVADNPAIWVRGRWSGRNPYPTRTGEPSSDFPADDFLSGGQGHFLEMTPAQELSWRYQLYGVKALQAAPAGAATWAAQVKSGLIPSPTPPGGLRQVYDDGLDAFDSWSESLFGVPFPAASPTEQDLMVELAGNVIIDALAGNLPSGAPAPVPPAAVTTLFPIITLHTFQATYGIPEYAWRNGADDPTVIRGRGTAQWRAIGYDGDTEPLGNSLFDPNMFGPGEGPNRGFGAEPGSADAEAGVFVPFGGYHEYRPVSTLAPGGPLLTEADAAIIQEMMTGRGAGRR
jgi:hypothetical protein